jgi:hypothetical protein
VILSTSSADSRRCTGTCLAVSTLVGLMQPSRWIFIGLPFMGFISPSWKTSVNRSTMSVRSTRSSPSP